jgi:hypothetical protein
VDRDPQGAQGEGELAMRLKLNTKPPMYVWLDDAGDVNVDWEGSSGIVMGAGVAKQLGRALSAAADHALAGEHRTATGAVIRVIDGGRR